MRTVYLCQSLGFSKQAYYKGRHSVMEDEGRKSHVLSIVRQARIDMPGIGVQKLWVLFNRNGLRVGRDWLYRLLRENGLLVKTTRKRVKTTDSRGWRRQFPNLVKGRKITSPNQVWVSDITYLNTRGGFVYLSLLTDAYSRKIVGWHVHPTLDTSGPLVALVAALDGVGRGSIKGLIHHSDRGGQYCSAAYTRLLKERHVRISMTQNGSPYDNAIAERVNGILKNEWLDKMTFNNIEDAKRETERVVNLYNTRRLHAAINFLVPEKAHQDRSGCFARVMF